MTRILILLASLFLLSSSAWSAGTLKVTTPNGGEKWTTGKSYAVKWSKGSAGATVKIQLLKSGKHYKWVSKKTKNDGKHTYKIPTTVVTSSAYKIKIVSIKNKKIFDTSNKAFKITKAASGGTLKVTTPNGGQKWTTGKTYQIKWSKGKAGAKVKIQLLKNGKTYKWISKSTANDGKHAWKIPSTVATASTYKIKITSTTKKTVTDSSDSNFKITKAATSKPTISLSCTPSSASESRGKFTCTLSLSQSTTKSVKVGLAYSGTATAGTDYSGHYASRTIPKGKTSTKWKLTGKADSKTEGNETIIINVTSVTNATEKGTQKASLVLTDKTSAIKVTTPNGGESWTTGKSYDLKWSKGDAGSKVKIELLKSGKKSLTISKSTKNDGKHKWKIPSTVKTGSKYKIKITSSTKKTVTDSSDSNFTITKAAAFGLTSSVFTNNGAMPDKYTCDGPNVSPPLKISGMPDGTVSLVLRFTDEDYPFEHWILYDIPLISKIKADSVPTGAHQGPNGRGDNTYRGPCGKYHVYRFYLYAIDKKLGYGNGVEWGQINDAISGHILKSTTLTTDDSKRS